MYNVHVAYTKQKISWYLLLNYLNNIYGLKIAYAVDQILVLTKHYSWIYKSIGL